MRKDIVLAAAVLSVFAGSLTVGYAQNPTRESFYPADARVAFKTMISHASDDELSSMLRGAVCADLSLPSDPSAVVCSC